jgi:dihydrolipoamide dehydrogenase
MIANKATAQAWTAGLHAAGQEPVTFSPEAVIGAIYTEPQVAQAGQLSGEGVKTVRASFKAGMKAHLLPEADGFVKLAYDENGILVGGTAVGPHAADIIAPVSVAIQAGMSIQQFGVLYGAHPTMSELAFTAARGV